LNAPDALRCLHCGSRLDEPAARRRRSAPRASSGAIWLDDLEAPSDPAPAAAATPVTEPDVPLTLRDVAAGPGFESAAPIGQRAPNAQKRAPADASARLPVLAAVVEPVVPSASPTAGPPPSKAQRRAAVRRARQRSRTIAPGAPGAADVLVCDADPAAREALCALLRGFGFAVHVVERALDGVALLAARRFIAAFVDVTGDAGDGGAGMELCRRCREFDQKHGARTLLVLTSARMLSIERVHAEMAGCDEIVLKPATRGKLAGALDRHGIALPADPRAS
jgi:CheY-like chemotaxis protein